MSDTCLPRRLSASLLAALGINSSCTASPCLKMTPCLDYSVDTGCDSNDTAGDTDEDVVKRLRACR